MPAVAVILQRVQLGISGQIDGFRAALESDVPVDRDRIDLPFPAVLHIFSEPFGHDLVEQSAFGADSVPGPQILFASLVPQIFERLVQVAEVFFLRTVGMGEPGEGQAARRVGELQPVDQSVGPDRLRADADVGGRHAGNVGEQGEQGGSRNRGVQVSVITAPQTTR